MNSNVKSRKTGQGDSDDEDQNPQGMAREHATMDIYRQRQQKRVKLANNSSTVDSSTAPVLTQ